MTRTLLVLACLLVPSVASANPREKGFLLGFGLTGGVVHFGDTGAGAGAHVRAGGIFADAHRIGVVLDGLLMQSWHEPGKHFHGAGTLGFSIWPQDRLSLSLGAGFAAADTGGDETVGSGPAVIGTVGYDVRHWDSSALVMRVVLAAADGDDGVATQATLTIGVDLFAVK